MCGICGFIRFRDNADASVLKQMNNTIRHRGPNDEGYFTITEEGTFKQFSGKDSVSEIRHLYPDVSSGNAVKLGLGFRRLSIIDLSSCGHQPMITEDAQFVITFNGEIYNYKELRAELIAQGLKFKSESDTEVILLGYKQWGKAVLQKLNGMFALVIYDKANHKLFIARDRVGIKPLFYYADTDGITWASEMKAVLAAPWIKHEINWDGLFKNYQLQTTPSPETCFQHLHSVKPGGWMEIDISRNHLTHGSYWQIPIGETTSNISVQEAVNMLDEKLRQIIKLQLRADVPVTSLMSGGIDSTLLTALCAKQHPGFDCYSLGFDGSGTGADELPQAMAMAKMLGIKQHIHTIKAADVIDDLEESIAHYEEPYMTLEPALAASDYLHKQGYKVVMNGLGADEVFGGYTHYLDYKNWQQRRKLAFLEALVPAQGTYFKKVKNYLGLDTALKYFINSRLGLRTYELSELLGRVVESAGDSLHEQEPHIRNVPESLFYYDLKYYIGAHHVYRDDLSGMKNSLEVRYPYLDHELIEWVSTLPLDIRYNDLTTKPLLKEVATRYITKENLSMPKKGFNLPLDKWIKEDNTIQNYAYQNLQALKKRGIFNAATIDKWWQLRNEGVYFSKIWQLVTTEVWLQTYID